MLAAALGAQTKATVPFVGCQAYGQTDTAIETPRGTTVSAPVNARDAKKLAYYKTALRVAVLAPRGWNCIAFRDSGGDVLFVVPGSIDRKSFRDSSALSGYLIEVEYISSENGSGRQELAELISAVFPTYKAVAIRFWQGLDAPLPSESYPRDKVTRESQSVVEYQTPPQTEGLGTHLRVMKNDRRIDGVAILVNPGPDSVVAAIRLPPELVRLTRTIIRQVERDASLMPYGK